MERKTRIELIAQLLHSKKDAIARATSLDKYIITCLEIENSNWIVKEFPNGKFEKLKKIE